MFETQMAKQIVERLHTDMASTLASKVHSQLRFEKESIEAALHKSVQPILEELKEVRAKVGALEAGRRQEDPKDRPPQFGASADATTGAATATLARANDTLETVQRTSMAVLDHLRVRADATQDRSGPPPLMEYSMFSDELRGDIAEGFANIRDAFDTMETSIKTSLHTTVETMARGTSLQQQVGIESEEAVMAGMENAFARVDHALSQVVAEIRHSAAAQSAREDSNLQTMLSAIHEMRRTSEGRQHQTDYAFSQIVQNSAEAQREWSQVHHEKLMRALLENQRQASITQADGVAKLLKANQEALSTLSGNDFANATVEGLSGSFNRIQAEVDATRHAVSKLEQLQREMISKEVDFSPVINVIKSQAVDLATVTDAIKADEETILKAIKAEEEGIRSAINTEEVSIINAVRGQVVDLSPVFSYKDCVLSEIEQKFGVILSATKDGLKDCLLNELEQKLGAILLAVKEGVKDSVKEASVDPMPEIREYHSKVSKKVLAVLQETKAVQPALTEEIKQLRRGMLFTVIQSVQQKGNVQFDWGSGLLSFVKDITFERRQYEYKVSTPREKTTFRESRGPRRDGGTQVMKDSPTAAFKWPDQTEKVLSDAVQIIQLFHVPATVVRHFVDVTPYDNNHFEWLQELRQNRVELLRQTLLKLGVSEDLLAADLEAARFEGNSVRLRFTDGVDF
jgi:hypothetical protein